MRRDPNKPRVQSYQQRGSLQLTSGTWRLRYRAPLDDNGRREHRSIAIGKVTDFASLDAVRAEADRLLEAQVPRRLLPGATLPWSAWCGRFEREYLCLLRRSSATTFKSILAHHVGPSFAHLKVHEVTVPVIQEWVSAQVRAGVKRNTVLARFGLLRLVLRRAHAAGLAAIPPAPRSVTFQRQAEIALPAELGFSRREVEQLVQAAEPFWFRALLVVLGFGGLRIGEALGLQRQHVDLTAGVMRVRQTISRGRPERTKTSHSRRDVPLHPIVKTHLATLLAVLPDRPDAYLFEGPAGKPRSANGLRTAYLRPLLRKLQMPTRSFHGFRHGLATTLLSAGASVSAVRDVLGHASIAQTNDYAAADVTAQQRAIDGRRADGLSTAEGLELLHKRELPLEGEQDQGLREAKNGEGEAILPCA